MSSGKGILICKHCGDEVRIYRPPYATTNAVMYVHRDLHKRDHKASPLLDQDIVDRILNKYSNDL